MTVLKEETIKYVLELSRDDRAFLAAELMKSLDEMDPELRSELMEEVNRRWAAYERGEMQTFSEEEVFADLDEL